MALPESHVVLSLTSHAGRFSGLEECLKRFSNQILKPDLMVLNIAEDEEFLLPHEVKNLEMPFKFEINFTTDLGPGKKIIPTLRSHPDSIIITVDDDLEYPDALCLDLLGEHEKYPEAIICGRVNLPFFEGTFPVSYSKWNRGTSWTPKFLHMAGTGGGTLFPPGSLHIDVLDEINYSKNCWSTDDLWIWIHTLRQNTEMKFTPIVFSESENNVTGLTSDGNYHFLNNYNLYKLWNFYKMEEVVKSYVSHYDIELATLTSNELAIFTEQDPQLDFKIDSYWEDEGVNIVLDNLEPRIQIEFTKVLMGLIAVIENQLKEQKKLRVTIRWSFRNLVKKIRDTRN
jgi:hypothetical protein